MIESILKVFNEAIFLSRQGRTGEFCTCPPLDSRRFHEMLSRGVDAS